MFRVGNNVPDVYMQESRDFQLLSRLYDLVFQAARFSIDSMEQISDTMRCNDLLLPLVATKVGFFTDLNLTSKADRICLSAFPYIIKYKGSLQGITLVANVFEQITNTNVGVQLDKDDSSHVTITFEDYTPDIDLLYSLLSYIRPVGLLIDYVVRSDVNTVAEHTMSDTVRVRVLPVLSTTSGTESGLIVRERAANSDNPDIASNVGFTQIST